MPSPIKRTFIYAIASRLSLYDLNQWWSNCFANSLLSKPFLILFQKIRAALAGKTGYVGTLLQKLSLIVALLLLLCLGLPQFANDKIGLALISTAGLISWVLGYLLGGEEKQKPDIIDFVVLLYLGLNIVSAFASHYFVPSLKGLAKVIVYIGSYFLFTSIARQSKKNTLLLLGTATLTGILLSLHGLYQYKIGVAPLATWEDPTVESVGTRIYSTLGNPNLLAGFLIPLSPMALGLASTFLAEKKWFLSAILYIGFALITVATVLTGSRGGYIAIFASLFMFLMPGLIYVWRHKRKLRPYIAIVLVIGILGSVFALTKVPSFQTRLQSIFAGREHSSNSYRLNVWSSSADMLKDNWWFGVGVGNETFRLAYGLYMVSGYDALGTYCVPLEVAVECGLFALLVFLILVICLLARSHLIFWKQETLTYRWTVLGLASALVGLMTHGLVDTVFYRPQVHFIFWLIVAVLTISAKFEQTQEAGGHRDLKINSS